MNEDRKEEMKSSWNDKADSNAYHWVDSTQEEWEKDAYYKRGLSEAQEFIFEPLVAYGVSPDSFNAKKILDIGCGTGRLVRFFAGKAKEVKGIDISDEMINRAKADNMDLPNVAFEVGNGIDFSLFNNAYFDIVYSFIVFQHVPDRSVIRNYVREMHRVLKTGGKVRFQVRGYPGRLRVGVPPILYKGFNRFYIAINLYKGFIPIPIIRKYGTVYGAFFKDREIEAIAKAAGFNNILIVQDMKNHRYLWVTATK